jgi:hypothetical protein
MTRPAGKTSALEFVLGADVFLFIGADAPTAYDPSFMKTFATDASLIDSIRSFEEPAPGLRDRLDARRSRDERDLGTPAGDHLGGAGGHGYITARELRAVVPDSTDAALADQGGEQPDPGLLAAVIETACQEVDALIEGRVRLPLSARTRRRSARPPSTSPWRSSLPAAASRCGGDGRKISGIRSDLGRSAPATCAWKPRSSKPPPAARPADPSSSARASPAPAA